MDKMKIDHAVAQAIVDTIREPLLVLDEDLRVVAANRSFYLRFRPEREFVQGRLLGELREGQWDIPALRTLLESIAPDEAVLEDYEVESDFPELGRRTLLLNARKMIYDDDRGASILLSIEDITDRRAIERERDELLRQKDLLLAEMQHRVANSLAIIASILLMKARTVASEETRTHLQDAHKRVLSVATVQKHLQPAHAGAPIDLNSYLTQLCASLAESMINDGSCAIKTEISKTAVTSTEAVSVGLIVTELVINALKHAFPEAKAGCAISVGYEINGSDWKLSIADNGVGADAATWPPAKAGLGTVLVNSLAEQLHAHVETMSGPEGTTVAVTRSTFKPSPTAA